MPIVFESPNTLRSPSVMLVTPRGVPAPNPTEDIPVPDYCCDPIGGIRLFASQEDVLTLNDRTYLRSGILADSADYPELIGTPFEHPAGTQWELVSVITIEEDE